MESIAEADKVLLLLGWMAAGVHVCEGRETGKLN